MQIQARNKCLLAAYQLLFPLCQAASSVSHPPLQDRTSSPSKSNSNNLHFNSPTITKLDQKFKNNCFFHFSGNFCSTTINVLLHCKKCQSSHNCLTLLLCLQTSIFNSVWCEKKAYNLQQENVSPKVLSLTPNL